MNSIEIKRLYEKYFDTIYRICFLYMKNEADAADVVQDVFCRMIKRNPFFEDDEKAKARTNVADRGTAEGNIPRRNLRAPMGGRAVAAARHGAAVRAVYG